jgi:hypothetical protein
MSDERATMLLLCSSAIAERSGPIHEPTLISSKI